MPLVQLLRELTERAFADLASRPSKLNDALSAFARLLIADGSLLRLHDELEVDYPSVWTNHTRASAKLHVVIDGATRTPRRVRIAPGSSHDLSLMQVDACCIGSLYVFDLAYYQGKLFQQILERGGHFLCRVKKTASFEVLSADDPSYVGRRHTTLLEPMRGRTFDIEVAYVYRQVRTRPSSEQTLRLRLFAVWCAHLDRHRLYLTSASRTALEADAVAAVYTLRWEVELLFRELKSQLRIDDIPTGNKAVVECLIHAALLALALGRSLHGHLTRNPTCPDRRFPPERWTSLLRVLAPMLLELLLGPPDRRVAITRRLLRVLRHEGPDPNRRRLLLPDRAQAGRTALAA
ncbi:MAG TPA: IS4 family transposase [Polyangiaceae bacterium]|nr:IS4 family transposase [Polyangiaceae bacterium]